MSNRRNNDTRQSQDSRSMPSSRPVNNGRYHLERGRDALRSSIRKEPSSVNERQQIYLENDLYERQSI